MNKTDRRIALAIRAAYKAPTNQRHRLGCVIFRKSQLVGFGWNDSHKTHPRSVNHPYGNLHAEIHALIGVSAQDLQDSVAYVARIRPSGPGIARPCPSCMKALVKAGVRAVFYTNQNGSVEREELK